MTGSDMRHLDTCGIEYRHRPGSGPHVVMLHGIGSDATSFNRLLPHLPADWNILAWNAPGYGGSRALSTAEPGATDYAERLEQFVETLGICPLILVGHSLGTLFAAAYAERHPEHITGLVLMACAEGYGINRGEALPDKAADRLAALARMGPQAFAEARAPRLMERPEAQPDVLADAIATMSRINPTGYGQAVHALSKGHLAASLAQLSVASLVLVGRDDVITPPEQSLQAHHALSAHASDLSHDWLELDDAGHIVHQQQPEAVAKALHDFVARLQPKRESV